MINLAEIESRNGNDEDHAKAVRVSLGGDVVWATVETWNAEADKLVAKHGGGVPTVTNVMAPIVVPEHGRGPLQAPVEVNSFEEFVTLAGEQAGVAAGSHDVIGEARSTVDFEMARIVGFAPKDAIYRRGTRVNGTGVENAGRSRVEHDSMPSVGDACDSFRAVIAQEERRDRTASLATMRMTPSGDVQSDGARLAMTERGFQSLVNVELNDRKIGGAAYLAACPPELRATNVNYWLDSFAISEAERSVYEAQNGRTFEPKTVKLRTRNTKARCVAREIFGVVSGARYTPFDVDKVAEAIQLATNSGAKCRITYDGQSAIFDVEFHSNVLPENYVAGEFFRAGLRIKTDDTGAGGIVGDAFVTQNLCLNLIIIDRATQPLFRLRHVGNVAALAASIRMGIERGHEKLNHFLKAWNYAAQDDRIVPAPDMSETCLPEGEQLMRGILNDLLERELVPVRGRREEVLPQLLRMWSEDDSFAGRGRVTRGAVVNVFTRYAHRVEQDEFATDAIERAVPSLLYGRGSSAPLPLRYLPAKVS